MKIIKNKLIILSFFSVFMYAHNIEYYIYNVNLDYNEYVNGKKIDGDSSKFGELVGFGVKYKGDNGIFPFFIKGEIAYGKSDYNGATQNGTPLSVKENNVKIINLQTAFFVYKPFYVGIGYREWNRGKSDYEGDYDEVYYWGYINAGFDKHIQYNENLSFNLGLECQYAVNPKIDIYIGNGTTLNLGKTYGYKAEIDANHRINSKLVLNVFYRYQFWRINRSNEGFVTINNYLYPLYEPESYTRNQYIGAGLSFKF
jgi:hypothetical protein